MVHIPDHLIRLLVYSVVVVLFLWAARVYGMLVLLVDFGVLLRATIQIHAGGKDAPWKGQRPNQRGERGGNDGRSVSPPERLSNHPSPKVIPKAALNTMRKAESPLPFRQSVSPPPYSFDPPKLDAEPRPESILKLYEDIIGSDAQTIQVQQNTMSMQQETIRAQSQLIKNMRLLLEKQDEKIEELERLLEGPQPSSP